MIVGEAWGEQEELQRAPFVGPAGYLLTQMLQDAGIHRAECYLTNVFNLRPANNDLETLCGPKETAIPDYPAVAKKGNKQLFVRHEFLPELTRLYGEISTARPNIIIACGGTATWALLRQTGITKVRGTTVLSERGKVLPTYHPAAVLRDWSLRPVTVLDYKKAEREAHSPDLHRVRREIWLEPSLSDLDSFAERYISGCDILSIDIETSGDQITCIGFAPDKTHALVVPIFDLRKPDNSYWAPEEEVKVWRWIRAQCASDIPKVFQNGLYDIPFLWRQYGIPCRKTLHDTMILHWAMQPESEKSLQFLASVYTNEAAWKMMKPRGRHTIKKED